MVVGKWTKRLLVLATIAIILNSLFTLIMMIEIYKIAIATKDMFNLITEILK